MASTDRPTPSTLYFAFGSNMRLHQMAERCPRSSLYARGRLCHYRWQINHRGVANIVKSGPEDIVEGLLFSITRRDELALDRNEGVARGLYNKEYLRVEVEPLLVEPSPSVKSDIAATAAWLKQHTQGKAQSTGSPSPPPEPATSPPPSTSCGFGQPSPPGPMASSIQSSEAASDESRSTERRVVNALVYVSNHTQDGEIRPEYVPRMHSAMSDAEELGVSKTYLDTCLRPLVSARAEGPASVEQEAAEDGEPQPSQHSVAAGRRCDSCNGEIRRRDPRHASNGRNAPRREHQRRRRHRGERSRAPRGYVGPPIHSQDIVNTHRRIGENEPIYEQFDLGPTWGLSQIFDRVAEVWHCASRLSR